MKRKNGCGYLGSLATGFSFLEKQLFLIGIGGLALKPIFLAATGRAVLLRTLGLCRWDVVWAMGP